jgi:hypothetical protein
MKKKANKRNILPKAKKGAKIIHSDDSEETNPNDANL